MNKSKFCRLVYGLLMAETIRTGKSMLYQTEIRDYMQLSNQAMNKYVRSKEVLKKLKSYGITIEKEERFNVFKLNVKHSKKMLNKILRLQKGEDGK